MDSPILYQADLEPVLRRRLADLDRQALPATGLRRAAIAVVVVPDDEGRASLVLTRRADHLGRHSGQYALPGGKLDPGESVVEAALRELREEVALVRDESHVLGHLDDFVTVRRHITESEFEHPMLALEIVGTWVFAPTAAILLQMAELTVHGRVLRVAHYEQPKFAWS